MTHRLIVLAAGEGLSLDGFNKALIRHPRSGESVLEGYLRQFADCEITVVVGYRAIEIMHRYPRLRYVYNSNWRLTGNAYSLGLALDQRPCFVLSADFFMGDGISEQMRCAPADTVFVAQRSNRPLNALNLGLRHDGSVETVYQGAVRSPTDPEALGLFKIESPTLLREWKARCIEHSNLFAVQNLPFNREGAERVQVLDLGNLPFFEVNTPLDYLNLIESTR